MNRDPEGKGGTWVRALPSGGGEAVWVEGIPVALGRIDGKPVAVLDDCPDESLPLGASPLAGDRFVCPHHGATFCARTGSFCGAGRARHPDRCSQGLVPVQARTNAQGSIDLLVTTSLRASWESVRRRRPTCSRNMAAWRRSSSAPRN